ncbi:Predicted arabinose efflux permease, MFS family [Paraburkholderia steynii]|uniref:Predicted arabinose efflux permease, MFS family n=1 Tax=Paraburkholderia steynii TaxID=1245441 RepID=A0A7Z7FJC0_9BURK|nr:MFS transporter [Paraburkholderia steynii]SDI49620.1 Predicted arabinose efflux permease, MFS family [Paraburkholderia steynii]
MSNIESWPTRAVLIVCHVAGMVDMVALPVWVGNLVQRYGFNSQQAGGIVTLFLTGVVLASVLLAPRFDRLPRRWIPAIGYGISAIGFLCASVVKEFGSLAALHVVSGLGVGVGLSFIHGTMGCSQNPHRIFAYAQAALGLFAVGFLGVVPQALSALGGSALFVVFAGVMSLAAVCAAAGFPAEDRTCIGQTSARQSETHVPRATWFAVGGVLVLTLNQAMMFSFLERIGIDRHFGTDRVNFVLLTTGIVGLFPALIAAVLQRRLDARAVALTAPWAQAALALTVTNAATFLPYALAGSIYPFVTLFAHTFLFGLIARIDQSGRAVASTPAMIMSGSAVGPLLAGTLALGMGYWAIGICVVLFAAVSTLLVWRIPHGSSAPEHTAMGIAH